MTPDDALLLQVALKAQPTPRYGRSPLLAPSGRGAHSEALHITTCVNAAAIQGTDIKQSTN